MDSPFLLASDLCYSDPSIHIFSGIRNIQKPLDEKTRKIYRAALDAADRKIRYASLYFVQIMDIFMELEHGEFIYFDDENRLRVHAALESHLIFLRASLDLLTRAWWSYFTGSPAVDSLHDLLKKFSKGGMPKRSASQASEEHWQRVLRQYTSSDFNWLTALVGTTRGQSLRDIAVHRSVLCVDTAINDRGRGIFVLQLGKDSEGDAVSWIDAIFTGARELIDRMVVDILEGEDEQPRCAT